MHGTAFLPKGSRIPDDWRVLSLFATVGYFRAGSSTLTCTACIGCCLTRRANDARQEIVSGSAWVGRSRVISGPVRRGFAFCPL